MDLRGNKNLYRTGTQNPQQGVVRISKDPPWQIMIIEIDKSETRMNLATPVSEDPTSRILINRYASHHD